MGNLDFDRWTDRLLGLVRIPVLFVPIVATGSLCKWSSFGTGVVSVLKSDQRHPNPKATEVTPPVVETKMADGLMVSK